VADVKDLILEMEIQEHPAAVAEATTVELDLEMFHLFLLYKVFQELTMVE